VKAATFFTAVDGRVAATTYQKKQDYARNWCVMSKSVDLHEVLGVDIDREGEA